MCLPLTWNIKTKDLSDMSRQQRQVNIHRKQSNITRRQVSDCNQFPTYLFLAELREIHGNKFSQVIRSN